MKRTANKEDCPCGSRGLYGVCQSCAPLEERTANQSAVLAYAQAFADYLAGTSYGQMGGAPALLGIGQGAAECIMRAVQCGRRASAARRHRDEAGAGFEHEAHRKGRGWAHQQGLSAAVIDECFAIGYRV